MDDRIVEAILDALQFQVNWINVQLAKRGLHKNLRAEWERQLEATKMAQRYMEDQ